MRYYLFFILLFVFSCSIEQEKVIYTSIEPQAFLINKITGGKIRVESLIKSNMDPHLFGLSSKDVLSIEQSSAFIGVGLSFEKNLFNKFKGSKNINLLSWEALAVDHPMESEHHDDHSHEDEQNEHEDEHSHEDEHHANEDEHHDHEYGERHPWLEIANIENYLIATYNFIKDANLMDTYELDVNLKNALKEFHEFEVEAKRISETIKVDYLFSYHDAWSYLAHDLNLDYYVVERHGKEVTSSTIVEIKNNIQNKGMKYIINQPINNQKIVENLANELKLEVVNSNPLEYDLYATILNLLKNLAKY